MTDKLKLESFHNGTNCKAYEFYGCHIADGGKYTFRVWAPHAVSVSVVGSFNQWNDEFSVMQRLSDGESFEVTISAQTGDIYKYCILTADGRKLYKCDPYAFGSDLPYSTASKISELPQSDYNPAVENTHRKPVNIFEVNLLSWKRHKDKSYYTFAELEKTLVPYVKRMGYTHVELMPVTEFPYDGSWGYQVTGYFSVTSRLGTPKEFKKLIDAFHFDGIKVILDWVPAHFPKDEWALYEFDGEPLYECPLWERMESSWGTRKFDFGRAEVDSFLLSSATFFFDKFGIDGLRVDAVASMLYLDYDKRQGQWTPNVYGDNRNLVAIEFIKKLNVSIKKLFPYAVLAAEESTVFPNVTKSVEEGGMGFDYKWNLGWMNDVLFYCKQDPYFRSYHHNKITFSMMYAFSEKYILPLSHDEVVHVKGSIINKMFGEYEDKFAGVRALLGFMYAHPGKKLNFMGYETAQFKEWDYTDSIEYFLKKFVQHRKMSSFVKALNLFYIDCEPLYDIDDGWDGFKWRVVDDRNSNLLAFTRYAENGESLTAVINFSGIDLFGYCIPVDNGNYRVVFNSDAAVFGGSGIFRKRIYKTQNQTSEKEGYIHVDIPKLACIYLKKQ